MFLKNNVLKIVLWTKTHCTVNHTIDIECLHYGQHCNT